MNKKDYFYRGEEIDEPLKPVRCPDCYRKYSTTTFPDGCPECNGTDEKAVSEQGESLYLPAHRVDGAIIGMIYT